MNPPTFDDFLRDLSSPESFQHGDIQRTLSGFNHPLEVHPAWLSGRYTWTFYVCPTYDYLSLPIYEHGYNELKHLQCAYTRNKHHIKLQSVLPMLPAQRSMYELTCGLVPSHAQALQLVAAAAQNARNASNFAIPV